MEKNNEMTLRSKEKEQIEFIMGRKLDETELAIYDLQKDDETYEFFIDNKGSLASRKIS